MSMLLQPGEVGRLGEYELLRRLGGGGMGTVYLGRARDGRLVAVKVIRAELAWDDELRGRFRSEVNRLQQVPSFSTAAVLDADFTHDPPYLVVEYVDGPSLAQVVRDRGPLAPEALHSLAVGLTTALSAIHSAGVIHRDLKPENVLLAVGGVKVIDFGIARSLEATSLHTRTDQMVGTVAYMAPERFEADSARAITTAADIFAWGVMIAFAATGRTPFNGDSAPATAMRIITQPPDLRGLHEPIRGLVERALAKDPRQRPTARGLLDGLLAQGSPATAPQQRTVYHASAASAPPRRAAAASAPAHPGFARKPRKHMRNALVAAGGAVALAVTAILAFSVIPPGSADEWDSAGAAPAVGEQLGGIAAASGDGTPGPVRPRKAATPRALLEVVSRAFPGRTISRYSTYDEKGRLFVQFLLDDGTGAGRLAIEVSRDKNPDQPERTGLDPVVEVTRIPANCYQDVVVSAQWEDGTNVRVDVSTCLPWNGEENPEAPPALTVDEAKKLATDPSWGVTMDAEIVDAGEAGFRKLRVLED